MDIIKFETNRNIRGAVIFSAIWLILITLFLSFFDVLKESGEEFTQAFSEFDDILVAFSGDTESVTQIRGFYNVEIFTLLHLSLNIYAVYKGVGIIGREITDKSLLFVMSKPVGRFKIFFSKMIGLILPILLINIILCFGSMLSISLMTSEEIPVNYLIAIYTGAFLTSVLFANLGGLVGVILEESKALSVSIGIVLISFVLNFIGNFPDASDIFNKISIHHYFDILYVSQNDSIRTPEIFLIVILSVVFLLLGLYTFKNKNIDI